MQNPMAAQMHYDEYRNRMAWVNANDWQFEKAAQRHPARQAVARALVSLARVLAPAAKGEAQTAA